MKLNLLKRKVLQKKEVIIVCSIAIAAMVIILLGFCMKDPPNNDMVYADLSGIEVTEEEMEAYKTMIGSDMDIKKSVFILFETEEECRNFIETHGADEHPEQAGVGIVPLMESGYYNIVGKDGLEQIFNTLADGEYSKEPIRYSNMFCYLKRIGVESPTTEEIKSIIQNDKMQEERRAGDAN